MNRPIRAAAQGRDRGTGNNPSSQAYRVSKDKSSTDSSKGSSSRSSANSSKASVTSSDVQYVYPDPRVDRIAQLLSRFLLNGTPWSRLPREIMESLAWQVFLPNPPNFDLDPLSRWPIDTPPDLSLTNVSSECKKLMDQKLLPDSVIITSLYKTCEACVPTRQQLDQSHDLYKQCFSSDRQHPWTTLRHKASRVDLEIRCCNRRCGRASQQVFATLYNPLNLVNVLTLTQLIMMPTESPHTFHRTFHRVVGVGCRPLSRIGAQHSVEFLERLGLLVYGVCRRRPKPSGYGFPADLVEPLQRAVENLYRPCHSWTDASYAHQAYLCESQSLLDRGVVPRHRMVNIAVKSFLNSSRMYRVPFAPFSTQKVSDDDIREFMFSEINGDAMLFLACHGLCDYLAGEIRPPMLPITGEAFEASQETATLDTEIMKVIRRKCRITRRIGFREFAFASKRWTAEDLAYLIHLSAMTQLFIRLRALALTRFLEPLNPPGHSMELFMGVASTTDGDSVHKQGCYIIDIGTDLDILERLNRKINIFREQPTTVFDFRDYNAYQIPTFITLYRKLLSNLRPLAALNIRSDA